MKRSLMAGVFALAMGWVVSTASACPDAEKTVKKDGNATLVKDKANTPCTGAKTVALKTDDGRSDKTGTVKKGGCSKPCGLKSAKTVAGKASPCGKNCKKGCCKKGAKTVAAGKGGCPIAAKVEAVLASLPAMQYRVGDEVIGCAKSAAAMAEKSGKPLEFVVGDESFKDKGEAMARLVKSLDQEVESLQTIQYAAGGKCGRCPVTAKNIAKSTGTKVVYRVGGVDFPTKEAAEKVVKLVSDAVKDVRMDYKVDGKTFHCSKAAGEKCKKSGKTMTYVIGDKETGCQTTAKLMQAETKVRRIVETAVAASFSL